MSGDDYAVLAENVCKSYGKNEILSNFCMEVKKGTIYGLLGASGCGKTTLLSCIVGRKKVKSGNIYVFGDKIGDGGSTVLGPCVGYMPQENALVGEFTVKDAVMYFGRILNMEDQLIEDRFLELKELLELPPSNRFIKDCSGGQQRRISFACAMIHHPDLLILDEPTVGLDPLLRDRIWKYLVKVTEELGTAVIITTHYIEETREAHRVGLMRGGKLLAEESPEYLIQNFNTESLEETFLILCRMQEEDQFPNTRRQRTRKNSDVLSVEYKNGEENIFSLVNKLGKLKQPKILKNNQTVNKKRVKALFVKHWIQYSRNLSGVAWTLIFPLIQVFAFFLSIGTDLKDLKLGIVNDENINNICWKYDVHNSVQSTDLECKFKYISCRYIEELDNTAIEKIYYNDVHESIDAIKTGKLVGALHIGSNFSVSLQDRLYYGRSIDNNTLESSKINVWLDQSNRPIYAAIKKILFYKFVDLQKKLFSECDYNERAGDLLIKFMPAIYGNNDDEAIIFMAPGFIMSIICFMGTTMTASIILQDRLEGIWDRSIIAGVTASEILITHFVTQLILLLLQITEILSVVFLIFETANNGSTITMLALIILQGVCGMCFGLWISTVTTMHTFANFVSTGSFYPMVLISGIAWPVEGQPDALKYISKCMPFTIPIESLRNVMKKGWSTSNFEVYKGILIEIGWIVGFIILCLIAIKSKQ